MSYLMDCGPVTADGWRNIRLAYTARKLGCGNQTGSNQRGKAENIFPFWLKKVKPQNRSGDIRHLQTAKVVTIICDNKVGKMNTKSLISGESL